MQRAHIASAIAVLGAVAFAVARPSFAADAAEVQILDRIGVGVIAGGVIGAVVGLLAHSLVGAALKLDTQAAFQALVVGFGAKALGAILPFAAITFLPQVSALAHPIAYLVAYAAAVLTVLAAGVLDNVHLSNEIALDAMEAQRGANSSSNKASSSTSSVTVATAAASSAPQGSSTSLESAS